MTSSPPLDSLAPANLSRRFWRLTALNIFTNLTVPLASLVDTALLGHLPDIMLVSVLLGFLPLAFVALRLGSNHLLWLAISIFMAARAGTLWWSDRRLSSPARQRARA